MIPHDYITEWRAHAPWVQDFQVEQDLVMSRAVVEIFSHPLLHEALAFRGGTALYKLHLKPAARYSEDIDLVQTRAEAAGPMMEALRSILDPWLGKPRWKQTEGRVTFIYRFDSEDAPPVPLENIALKLQDPLFTADISALLAADFSWNVELAAPIVSARLIELLPGAPWKGKD